jgi:hypothetical protein
MDQIPLRDFQLHDEYVQMVNLSVGEGSPKPGRGFGFRLRLPNGSITLLRNLNNSIEFGPDLVVYCEERRQRGLYLTQDGGSRE